MQTLTIDDGGNRLSVQLNRPEVRNAIDQQMVDELHEVCADLERNPRILVLSGTGGVFAMGCTIGQGISAVSVMAVSAPLVIASIFVGARMGLAYLIEGSPFAAFRPLGGAPAE